MRRPTAYVFQTDETLFLLLPQLNHQEVVIRKPTAYVFQTGAKVSWSPRQISLCKRRASLDQLAKKAEGFLLVGGDLE